MRVHVHEVVKFYRGRSGWEGGKSEEGGFEKRRVAHEAGRVGSAAPLKKDNGERVNFTRGNA